MALDQQQAPQGCGHPNCGNEGHRCEPFQQAPQAGETKGERPKSCPACGSFNPFVIRKPCSIDSHEPDPWHRPSAALQPQAPEEAGEKCDRCGRAETEGEAGWTGDEGRLCPECRSALPERVYAPHPATVPGGLYLPPDVRPDSHGLPEFGELPAPKPSEAPQAGEGELEMYINAYLGAMERATSQARRADAAESSLAEGRERLDAVLAEREKLREEQRTAIALEARDELLRSVDTRNDNQGGE